MTEPVAPLTGSCMCGAVRFRISAPLVQAEYCHCKRCQRRTGTAFSASGLTAPGSFSIVKGEDAVGTYRPGDGGWHKSYCAECGGHLFGTDPANAERLVVRMGALDQDPGVRPSVHQFVDYAAPWEPIPDDGLPRYPDRMTGE